MAIQPIQNRANVIDEERREKSRDSKASKKPLAKPSFANSEASDSEHLDNGNASLDGQIIDSEHVIELLNHKPTESLASQRERLRQAVKTFPENSPQLNKKL